MIIGFEEAFQILEEGRESHQSWLDAPDDWYEQSDVVKDIGGDREHHQKWVENYDKVIQLLKACQSYLHSST